MNGCLISSKTTSPALGNLPRYLRLGSICVINLSPSQQINQFILLSFFIYSHLPPLSYRYHEIKKPHHVNFIWLIYHKYCVRERFLVIFSSVQLSHSVVSYFVWPHECSTPGLPVHHHLPEFTQTHVHWVGDAIQPSHPRSSPFPPAPNPSQHQSLFQWVNSSHEVAKVPEFQL